MVVTMMVSSMRLFRASAATMLGKQAGDAAKRSAEVRQGLTWKVWEQIG